MKKAFNIFIPPHAIYSLEIRNEKENKDKKIDESLR
jgi:hypothetical protein